MVGPEVERTAVVRRFGAMFVAGARLTVPVCAVVLRKAYGLGAMAMTAGDLRRPAITVAWPTGEFGGMGLEGAVRLGYRRELDAIGDPAARQARYEQLVAEQYTRGKALSTAMAFEIDDVIDPADTRAVIAGVLARGLPVSGDNGQDQRWMRSPSPERPRSRRPLREPQVRRAVGTDGAITGFHQGEDVTTYRDDMNWNTF